MKSKDIGIREARKQDGTPITDDKETLLPNLKIRKKTITPTKEIRGAANKTYPAKQATAFPPLKRLKRGKVWPIATEKPAKPTSNSFISLRNLGVGLTKIAGPKDRKSITMEQKK